MVWITYGKDFSTMNFSLSKIYVKSYEIFSHFEYNSVIVALKKSPPRQNSKFIFPYVSLTNKEKYHFFFLLLLHTYYFSLNGGLIVFFFFFFNHKTPLGCISLFFSSCTTFQVKSIFCSLGFTFNSIFFFLPPQRGHLDQSHEIICNTIYL